MEATISGRVSLGRLSKRRLNLATTGTDMSNIPNNYIGHTYTDTDLVIQLCSNTSQLTAVMNKTNVAHLLLV